MFYASYGSLMHELLEQFYNGKIDKESMLIKFLFYFQKRVLGERPSEKIVTSYIQKGINYLESFQPLPFNVVGVEHMTEFKLAGYRFVGIIDIVGEEDGEYIVVDNKSRDLKPRSNRKKPTLKDQELEEMLKQLYIYSIPIAETFGKYPKELCFNCFKSNTFIREPFDVRAFDKAIKWAKDTIEEIKNTDFFSPNIDWFSCKYICGLHDECCYFE